MKILLAIDGSPCSEAAVQEVLSRPWPSGSEVKILSVVDPLPFIPAPTYTGIAVHLESLKEKSQQAAASIDRAAREIADKRADLHATIEILEGSPKEVILKEAERWGADLILVGSHGHGPLARFLLGSVSQAVALHAPCSVEIVRSGQPLVVPSGS